MGGPSRQSTVLLFECEGNTPSSIAKTTTPSHSKPLEAWTVMICTACGSGSDTGASNPFSRSSAMSKYARNEDREAPGTSAS